MRRIVWATTAAVLLSLTGSLIAAGPANAAWVFNSRHKTKSLCEARGKTILNNEGSSVYSTYKCLYAPVSITRPWALYMD